LSRQKEEEGGGNACRCSGQPRVWGRGRRKREWGALGATSQRPIVKLSYIPSFRNPNIRTGTHCICTAKRLSQ